MGRKRKSLTSLVEGTSSNVRASSAGLRRSNRLKSPALTNPDQVGNPTADRFPEKGSTPIYCDLGENHGEEDRFPKKVTTVRCILGENHGEEDRSPKKVTTSVHCNLGENHGEEDRFPTKGTTPGLYNVGENHGEEDRFPTKGATLVHCDLGKNQGDEDRSPKKGTSPVRCKLDDSDDDEDQHPKKDSMTSAQDSEPASENSNLDENDKENNQVLELGKSAEEKGNLGKQPQVEEMFNLQAADETNVEAETEYFVQSEDECKFDNDNPVPPRSSRGPSQDLSYKSLYIRAQKKIEILMEEKFALLQELQFSRGQITAFEKMKDMFTTREVIVVPGLPNATTSALSAQGRQQNNNVQSSAHVEDRNASPKARMQTYVRKSRRT